MIPKISICTITYNHEEFIAQAIEGVIMQKTIASYELVIGDDCSTDGTRGICLGYQKKFPDRIRLILREGNVGSLKNFIQTLFTCKGQYVALLEGDDYWTDPYKLQKQADFLDNNPDFAICFHLVDWLDQESGRIKDWKYGPPIRKPYYTIDDLLEHSNFIPTCSVMFRNNLFNKFPEWFFNSPVGDFPLNILNAQYGKIGFINEPMAVYRRHKGGLHGGRSKAQNLKELLRAYELMRQNLYLDDRASYYIGVSKWNSELCHAYWSEGKRVKAFLVGLRCFKIALESKKMQNFLDLVLLAPLANLMKKWVRSIVTILKRKKIRIFQSVRLTCASIYITDICNSKCISCMMWKNNSPTNLSIEKWQNIMKELYGIGVRSIDFTGGEPLLREDLTQLIQEAKNIGFNSICLCTNALLLDENKINELGLAGLTDIHLSIDGIGETHNKIRGVQGSFDKNIKALECLNLKKIKTMVCTNILESNISEIFSIIELCKKYNAFWFPNLINDTQYYFKGIEKNKLLALDKVKIDWLIDGLRQRLVKGEKHIRLSLESLPVIQAYLNGEIDFKNTKCLNGYSGIYIDAKGDVYTGCSALPSVGNVTRNPLSDIINADRYKNQVKRMYTGNCPGCTCNYMLNI